MKEFRRLERSDEHEFMDYIKEWKRNKEMIVPSATNFYQYKDFSTFFNQLKTRERQEIPNTTLFLFIDGKIVGAANIRHRLNPHLLNHGGHIGYGVRLSERGKGYASEMLKRSLEFLQGIDVKQALVTCDVDNPASAQVIINNGGKEDSPYIREDGGITRRFWIDIQ